MKYRTVVIGLILLFVVIFSMIRFFGQPKRMERTFFPMGGIPCRVVEYDVTSKNFDSHLVEIESLTDRLENVFNVYRKESEVSQLNGAGADWWNKISPTFLGLMEDSLKWFGYSGGAFDVTVGPLINLWKSAEGKKEVPTRAEVDSVLKSVGSEYITLSPERGLKFSRSHMKLDFGGIAKGLILDKIGGFLDGRGAGRYIVSCGGDVVMKGKESFKVGVQEPGGTEKDLMIILNLSPGAVVTSGHYERYHEIGGKKYSHIIDPTTGWPVDNNLVSITVYSRSATDADALATAIGVMGLEKSLEFLKKSATDAAVLVTKTGDSHDIYLSKSLSGKIELTGRWKNVPVHTF